MAVLSRRSLIGAGTATAMAGITTAAIAKTDRHATMGEIATVAVDMPDSALLTLADKFMKLQLQVNEINAGRPHTEGELDNLVIEQAAIMDEMNEHIVTTMSGHQARARVLVAWFGLRGMDDCPSEIDEYRIWPLCRDLIGGLV